jgi:hypothetical protein
MRDVVAPDEVIHGASGNVEGAAKGRTVDQVLHGPPGGEVTASEEKCVLVRMRAEQSCSPSPRFDLAERGRVQLTFPAIHPA